MIGMKPRMTETSLMSPNTDILQTPKQESLKTPKFREFSSDLAAGLSAALRSPRDVDSLNTPLALTTPLLAGEVRSPRTADWGLFSPINFGSSCSSPRESLTQRDSRPADLPLDSIGLSSPHDGALARRRKLKNQNHSRSVESDSNSCDTPTDGSAGDLPRDLSKKSCSSERRDSLSSPTSTTTDSTVLDSVRDRVGDVKISSPKWFKHPKHLPESLKLSKEMMSELPPSYHPSPLLSGGAVPSPNWTAIKEMLSNTQTPKVLDRSFIFDVLPPNTPTTKSYPRDRSPGPADSGPINYEKPKPGADTDRLKTRADGRVTFAECPRPGSLTPPPPIPEDLSMRSKPSQHQQQPALVTSVKPEYDPDTHQPSYRHSPPSPPPYPDHSSSEHTIKEEPRDYPPVLPPGFPPYYLASDITPHQLYRQSDTHHRPGSPTSPPRSVPSTNHYQHRPPPAAPAQFYAGLHRPLISSLYEHGQHGHHAQYNLWGHHDMGHVSMPTPSQHLWSRMAQQHQQHQTSETSNGNVHVNGGGSVTIQNYVNNLKPGLDKIKSETRLSTDSQDSVKKKQSRKLKQEETDINGDHEPGLDGQPPKKKGKNKTNKPNTKDPNQPKRVFVCPHCNVSITGDLNIKCVQTV